MGFPSPLGPLGSLEPWAQAAKDARIYDALMALPQKLDTFVGIGGRFLYWGKKGGISQLLEGKPWMVYVQEVLDHQFFCCSSFDHLVFFFIYIFIVWLIVWLIDWLIDGLIDCFYRLLLCVFVCLFVCLFVCFYWHEHWAAAEVWSISTWDQKNNKTHVY